MANAPYDRFGLAGVSIDGKFRVEAAVAEGGFGIVYRGTQIALQRPIAIKVLKRPPDLADGPATDAFYESFALEARAIAQINHTNIVQVLDYGVSDMPNGERAPWIMLEWLNGRTLRAELLTRRNRGGRTVAETHALLRPAVEALAFAHDAGIAHRDIKPANMILVESHRGSILKLLDFGVAKVMQHGDNAINGRTNSITPWVSFSLGYAAPEQVSGMRTGPWTDVHAMALLISELLTDQPAYVGADPTALARQSLAPERPTPARHNINVGPWEQVLAKALSLRPQDRYRNAGEFLAALDATVGAAAERVSVPVVSKQFAATIQAPSSYVPPSLMVSSMPGAIPMHPMSPAQMRGIHEDPSLSTFEAAVTPIRPRQNKSNVAKISIGIVASLVVLIGGASAYVLFRPYGWGPDLPWISRPAPTPILVGGVPSQAAAVRGLAPTLGASTVPSRPPIVAAAPSVVDPASPPPPQNAPVAVAAVQTQTPTPATAQEQSPPPTAQTTANTADSGTNTASNQNDHPAGSDNTAHSSSGHHTRHSRTSDGTASSSNHDNATSTTTTTNSNSTSSSASGPSPHAAQADRSAEVPLE